jgi:hypothetical protein
VNFIKFLSQVLNAQDDVVRREKELEEARGRLTAVRRSNQKDSRRDYSPDAYYSLF